MTRIKTRGLWLKTVALLACLCSSVLADPIDPDNPPQGTFVDDWMQLRLAGQPAGYIHSTMTREGDRISTRLLSVMSLARGATPISVTTMEASTETIAGAPLFFESSQNMATVITRSVGQVRDGIVHITKSQYGLTQQNESPYPKGALMAWGIMADQLRRGFKEGLEFEIDAYVPSLKADAAVVSKVRIQGRETIQLLDRQAEATRVETTLQLPTGAIDSTSWVDEDGQALKMSVAMMGIALEMIKTDKATATKDIEAPEFFVQTLVKANRKIDRHAAQSLKLYLSVAKSTGPLPDLPETGMQKQVNRSDDGVELLITRQDHAALRQSAAKASPIPEMDEFVSPNIWINSDDPKVISMANQAVKKAVKPYVIADTLRKYVTEIIREKNLSIGFASASEVCRNKEGDCSEHAVLLAALGRVHKLPSRIVIGLVYVPWFAGTADVFGFHMWTQFYIDGEWIDFDAAQRESDCNPTHIAIATSSLLSTSLAEMSFTLLKFIGGLEIRVIEANPASAITGN